jgi:hypothetical protein
MRRTRARRLGTSESTFLEVPRCPLQVARPADRLNSLASRSARRRCGCIGERRGAASEALAAGRRSGVRLPRLVSGSGLRCNRPSTAGRTGFHAGATSVGRWIGYPLGGNDRHACSRGSVSTSVRDRHDANPHRRADVSQVAQPRSSQRASGGRRMPPTISIDAAIDPGRASPARRAARLTPLPKMSP